MQKELLLEHTTMAAAGRRVIARSNIILLDRQSNDASKQRTSTQLTVMSLNMHVIVSLSNDNNNYHRMLLMWIIALHHYYHHHDKIPKGAHLRNEFIIS